MFVGCCSPCARKAIDSEEKQPHVEILCALLEPIVRGWDVLRGTCYFGKSDVVQCDLYLDGVNRFEKGRELDVYVRDTTYPLS